ncbi:hypothetical protein CEXT_156601 [Caerostris extrusa]|uniref:DUF4283 domain-containing protein n=1 Tax=Caerostris extrusa TaxID=172846 RepID=A0AAV4XE88_CAEEX|nr:hypothetical protein CEXT_156601 [Caerostris extrusa]
MSLQPTDCLVDAFILVIHILSRRYLYSPYIGLTYSVEMEAMVRFHISDFEPKILTSDTHALLHQFQWYKTLTVDVWVRIPLLTIYCKYTETPLSSGEGSGTPAVSKRPTVDCGT